ncbi:auxin-responsive protein SAUR15 [Cryptomeria japonica]|uniref:auxin-responsive protein SAUR15 n=1 Tax=Cryptomeria japonica TaxID=3369 RepID=UPI0027DAA4B0|nr:auxin-responsive protein SAUR15 [Cryptomeria japonica]
MARTKRNPCGVFLNHIKEFYCLVRAQKAAGPSLSPEKRKYFTLEDGTRKSSSSSNDVPKGHFAVYVGHDRTRFIVPTAYLNDSLFKALLQKSEEEYGFDHQMGITIPCEKVAFRYLTSMLGKKNPELKSLELDEIISAYCYREMDCES